MFASNPSAAVDLLFDSLQRALPCVTLAVLIGRRYHESDIPHVLTFDTRLSPVPIGRPAAFAITVRHFYRVSVRRKGTTDAPRGVSTVGYSYELFDRHEATVVAYHWHPSGIGGIDYSHLHVGRQFAHRALPTEVRATAERLVSSHLPTGPIVLPTVLRYAIDELGVEPLRRDWVVVLNEAERDVRQLLPE